MTALNPRWPAVADVRHIVASTPLDRGLFVALAPMDGVTDAVYRELLTELDGGRSGISLCVSEFVRVVRDPVPAKVIRRHCPEVDHGGRTRSGVPVFVQLLGGLPEPMAETARRAVALGAPGIDLNFGCPAKTVNNHDGGATLLKTPSRIEAITRAVRDVCPPHVYVTVKIRIGWDSGDQIEEIAKAAQRGGGDWLTIHARTRKQLYRPPVHWDVISRAQSAVAGMSVVANGDLREPDDLHACAKISMCEAFMIGRGAMGAPALFSRIRGWRDQPIEISEFTDLLLRYHAALMAAGRSEKQALCRVKQWLRMGALTRPDIESLFTRIKVMQAWEPMAAVLCACHRPPMGERSVPAVRPISMM